MVNRLIYFEPANHFLELKDCDILGYTIKTLCITDLYSFVSLLHSAAICS